MTKNFTIIGTGITGTAALIALVAHFSKYKSVNGSLPSIRVTTIDKRRLNGTGYPYDPDGSHPAHLLNHPATEMALKPVDEAGRDKQADFEVAGWRSYDFVRWLHENKDELVKNYPDSIRAVHTGTTLNTWSPRHDGHYPRGLFGLYARDRFNEAVADLRRLGVDVVQYNETEVVAAYKQGSRLILALKDLKTDLSITVAAEKVLIATGRWLKQTSGELHAPCYFEKPYPATAVLDAIKPAISVGGRPKRVVVKGMGLSALDTILTLATGLFYRDQKGTLRYSPGDMHAQIVAVSRSGYFPVVRGMPAVVPALKYFTREALDVIKRQNGGHLTLNALKLLFEQELREHLGQDFDLATYFLPKLTAQEKLRDDLQKARQGNVVYAVCRQILALQLFSQMQPDDKEYFTKNIRTLFLQNVAAMPVINAEKMLALFDAGVLSTVAVGYKGLDVVMVGDTLQLDYTDRQGNSQGMLADYMIEAVGDELSISRNPDPLIASLINQGEVISDVSGGIKVNLATYAVISSDGKGGERQSELVFALGMPVMNWAAERDFASASIKAAYAVASLWVRDIEAIKSHAHGGLYETVAPSS